MFTAPVVLCGEQEADPPMVAPQCKGAVSVFPKPLAFISLAFRACENTVAARSSSAAMFDRSITTKLAVTQSRQDRGTGLPRQ
jgi:hypothetical protein